MVFSSPAGHKAVEGYWERKRIKAQVLLGPGTGTLSPPLNFIIPSFHKISSDSRGEGKYHLPPHGNCCRPHCKGYGYRAGVENCSNFYKNQIHNKQILHPLYWMICIKKKYIWYIDFVNFNKYHLTYCNIQDIIYVGTLGRIWTVTTKTFIM